MKLGIAGHMGATHNDDDIVSDVGEVGQGAISGVRVATTLTFDDSELDVGEHDDDCEGCALCSKPAKRRSRARKVAGIPHFPERV